MNYYRRREKCCYSRIMTRVLLTGALLIAAFTQPLLALPSTCPPARNRIHGVCSSCCQAKPCCTASKRDESIPLKVDATLAGNLMIAAPPEPCSLSLWLDRATADLQPLFLYQISHAPPPRARSCIQLI